MNAEGFCTWLQGHDTGCLDGLRSKVAMVAQAQDRMLTPIDDWTLATLEEFLKLRPMAVWTNSGKYGRSGQIHAIKVYFAYKATLSVDKKYAQLVRVLEAACPSKTYWKLQLEYIGVLP